MQTGSQLASSLFLFERLTVFSRQIVNVLVFEKFCPGEQLPLSRPGICQNRVHSGLVVTDFLYKLTCIPRALNICSDRFRAKDIRQELILPAFQSELGGAECFRDIVLGLKQTQSLSIAEMGMFDGSHLQLD